MWILSYNGKKLVKAVSVFISEVPDREKPGQVFRYDVKATLPTGRTETIVAFYDEDGAKRYLRGLNVFANGVFIDDKEDISEGE